SQMVVATLAGMSIEVLDQRQFLGPWLLAAGTLTTRAPSDAERAEIRETFRRGGRLAGPGAVVVKTVAAAHDYRFDVPTVGPATLEAMREGGATALAVPAGRVLLVDREAFVRMADEAGIAVVSDDGGG